MSFVFIRVYRVSLYETSLVQMYSSNYTFFTLGKNKLFLDFVRSPVIA